jgi:hypothetical protein
VPYIDVTNACWYGHAAQGLLSPDWNARLSCTVVTSGIRLSSYAMVILHTNKGWL